MADVEKRIETAKKIAVNRRQYRRARDRALARLANQYPEEYAVLLEEERTRDEVEGKAWLDITGRTRADLDQTKSDRSSGDAQRRSNQAG